MQLEPFNEQTDILLGSRFAAATFSGPKVILKWVPGGRIENLGEWPDPEAVRAFALTFRMFYRDGDGISFRELAELYEGPSVPPDLRDAYRELRDGSNRFLDGKSAYPFKGDPIVERELLEVFLWGGLAHVNPARRKTYDAWRADQNLFTLLGVRCRRLRRASADPERQTSGDHPPVSDIVREDQCVAGGRNLACGVEG
jgi:hypothetical protein